MGTVLRSLINGFGSGLLPYWKTFLPFAGSIFVLLIVFEILREAIDISTGKGIKLAQKLIVISFVGTLLLGYGKISDKIYSAAKDIGETVITEFGTVGKNIEDSYMKGSERYDATLKKNGDEAGFIGGFFIGIVVAILSGISLMIIFFIMLLILIFVAGAYASLALILAIGPVFIAMLTSQEFRSIGIKWLLISLAYLIMIPVYVMVMKMMIQLYGQNAYNTGFLNPSSVSVSASIEQMILLMAGPFISLGLVLSVSRIVDQVVGSAGNIGETAVAAAAGTMYVSRAALKSASKSLKNIAKRGQNSSSGKSGMASGSSRPSTIGGGHSVQRSRAINSSGGDAKGDRKRGFSNQVKSSVRNLPGANPPRITAAPKIKETGRNAEDE